jgi:prophage maintenance system killer protein
LAIGLFLALNGFALSADQTDAVEIIHRLAAGKISEDELADRIRQRMRRSR